MASKLSFGLKTGLLFTTLFLSTHTPVFASIMSNSNLQLDTSPSNSLPIVQPQNNNPINTIPNSINSNQNIQKGNSSLGVLSQGSLSVQTSQSLLDFNEIMPGEPIIRSFNIQVGGQAIPQFEILGYEDTPLSSNNNVTIPDTSCDDGTCTPYNGSPWKTSLTFGFGYRCDIQTNGCGQSFSDPDVYKPFTHGAFNAVPIFSGNTNDNDQLTFTLKVNIPGTQPLTQYTNTISLLVLPKI